MMVRPRFVSASCGDWVESVRVEPSTRGGGACSARPDRLTSNQWVETQLPFSLHVILFGSLISSSRERISKMLASVLCNNVREYSRYAKTSRVDRELAAP